MFCANAREDTGELSTVCNTDRGHALREGSDACMHTRTDEKITEANYVLYFVLIVSRLNARNPSSVLLDMIVVDRTAGPLVALGVVAEYVRHEQHMNTFSLTELPNKGID